MSIMFAHALLRLKRAANTICLARSEKLSNIDPKIAQVKCVSMDIMPCKQFARTCLVSAVNGKLLPGTDFVMVASWFHELESLSSIDLRIQRIRVIALNSAKNVVPFESSIGIGKLYDFS